MYGFLSIHDTSSTVASSWTHNLLEEAVFRDHDEFDEDDIALNSQINPQPTILID